MALTIKQTNGSKGKWQITKIEIFFGYEMEMDKRFEGETAKQMEYGIGYKMEIDRGNDSEQGKN